METLSYRLAPALLALVLCAAPLSGQAAAEPQIPTLPAAPRADSAYQAGAVEGSVAAQAVGTGIWTVSAVAGGAILGPLGSGIVYALAGSSGSALPPAVAKKVGKKDPEYQRGYQEAFSQRLTSKRRGSVLTGGYLGTFIFGGTAIYAWKTLRN